MARLAARSSLSKHLGGALVQLLDGGEPRQPERFARDDDHQRQRRERRQAPAPRQPRLSLRANRSSIRLTTPSPRPSSTRPPSADQNSVPQRKPRLRRDQRRVDRHRQLRRVGLRRDLHRAARGRGWLVRIHHDHAGIVEPERRRPPCGVFSLIAAVSDQELQRAVEADMRQGRPSPPSRSQQRRPEAQEAVVGLVGRRAGEAAEALPSNSASGSSGRSPGKIAASVSPSNVSPPAISPAAGMPRIEGSSSRPRATWPRAWRAPRRAQPRRSRRRQIRRASAALRPCGAGSPPAGRGWSDADGRPWSRRTGCGRCAGGTACSGTCCGRCGSSRGCRRAPPRDRAAPPGRR